MSKRKLNCIVQERHKKLYSRCAFLHDICAYKPRKKWCAHKTNTFSIAPCTIVEFCCAGRKSINNNTQFDNGTFDIAVLYYGGSQIICPITLDSIDHKNAIFFEGAFYNAAALAKSFLRRCADPMSGKIVDDPQVLRCTIRRLHSLKYTAAARKLRLTNLNKMTSSTQQYIIEYSGLATHLFGCILRAVDHADVSSTMLAYSLQQRDVFLQYLSSASVFDSYSIADSQLALWCTKFSELDSASQIRYAWVADHLRRQRDFYDL